jgi:hypothetical protein
MSTATPWSPAQDDGPSPDRTESSSTWRVRRSPVPLAVAIIVVVALAGWGLRQWGVFNPAVTITSRTDEAQPGGPPIAQLSLANESGSAIDVTAVSVVRGAWAGTATSPVIAAVDGFVWLPLGNSSSRQGPVGPLPLHVPAHATAELRVTFALPFCERTPVESNGNYVLAVRLRTRSGRSKTVVPNGTYPEGPCTNRLPRGPQPAKLGAARAAVISAFAVVYDPARSSAARLALVDDPTGVARAGQAVFEGPYGSAARGESAQITDIEFDRPDHAWVRFDLFTGVTTNPVLRGRLGEARLVHGTWKVARSTVCADLALGGGSCG